MSSKSCFPRMKAFVTHYLVEMEIEAVNNEPSLDALQNTATNTASVLTQTVTKRLGTNRGKNYAKGVGAIQTNSIYNTLPLPFPLPGKWQPERGCTACLHNPNRGVLS